ncbi:hypothetical protein M407DRAFT_32914 [Tulasnella calospora MUT 4182]|uniref:Uncharacterized protein n=1 Tax=Tulasnella calospora MUT 4182 TaxID=1051891 RepID=A0A0C3Q372_9AGAM|nr:hypothetical protein M407DRAFT_32914 [Tulasnella calospora MUT 4182]
MDVGGTENGEPVFCSASAEDCAGQLWDLERASRTTLEIKTMPMVSENTKLQDTTKSQNEPPSYVAEDAIQAIPEGLYTLTNKKIRKLLVVHNGDIRSGTACIGWPRITGSSLDFQLWALKHASADGSYTLMSLRAGTYIDLQAGKTANRAPVIAHSYASSEPSRLNQEWRISEEVPGYYTLRCARTETFLEMDDESTEKWRKIYCSNASQERDSQLWSLDRVSRTSLEIKEVMGKWKPDLLNRLFQPYGDNDEFYFESRYIVLPYELRKPIWNETGLLDQAICRNTFDYDDFVIKAKDAMNSWARDNFRTYGYSILFGIIFGEAKKGPKAYNWYLSYDMGSLVFFDPQTGIEYTSAGNTRL